MVQKLDTVKLKGLWFESQQFQANLGQIFLRNDLGLSEIYQWIGQKILSCFHVKHFEIDPIAQKLDTVKYKGLRFKSRQFQTIFCRNFLMDTLGLSEVLPLDWAENSKLFSCITL